jgi:hypothetical protein
VRSIPRTITWCRVSGASRRAWRGMVTCVAPSGSDVKLL